ncbi:MAG: N-acetyl-D-Glu racemase DgcA [Pseudomonadota bacterium]
MDLKIDIVATPLRTAFAISRGAKTEARTVLVTLTRGDARGRGECVPYARYGETVDSVVRQIETVRSDVEAGLSRDALQAAMPAGAARCAVDCALWDLDAKRTGKGVWQLAGLPQPMPIDTAMTIGLDHPEAMGIAAKDCAGSLLKLKLGSDDDLARLKAVHRARPDARLIVDGNEGLDPTTFQAFADRAFDYGVELIEQPFPVGADDPLLDYSGPVRVCADESAHTSADIEALSERYQLVNIKLDKTGGLTEALAMQKAARDAGMGVMVGCMVAGSVSMAPAVLLGQRADFVDVDGPTWLTEDVAHGLRFENGRVYPPVAALWG